MNPNKVARICWNSNNWQKPSGRYGKSQNEGTYEYSVGFGHEEWLLDLGKIFKGFHYAYIQAVPSNRDTYIDKIFDISLYSINNHDKTRWWLGEIKNVHIVTREESVEVYRFYKKNGWLKEMISQLRIVDAAYKRFDVEPDKFVRIKFRVRDVNLLDMPLQFSHKDSAVKSDYYNLKNFIAQPKFVKFNKFLFKSGHTKKITTVKNKYDEHTTTIDLFHNRIQETIYKQFCLKYHKSAVSTENIVNGNSRIDIVVKNKQNLTFYEIKTSNSLIKCIRESIPQLLEYAYFPNVVNAKKLVIISHNKMTADAEEYLQHLRKKFNIPLYYQRFNLESNILEDQLY